MRRVRPVSRAAPGGFPARALRFFACAGMLTFVAIVPIAAAHGRRFREQFDIFP